MDLVERIEIAERSYNKVKATARKFEDGPMYFMLSSKEELGRLSDVLTANGVLKDVPVKASPQSERNPASSTTLPTHEQETDLPTTPPVADTRRSPK